ncbi:MAG: Arm DNA-binding domain-containing protein, partial [Rhodomicrobium sp.]
MPTPTTARRLTDTAIRNAKAKGAQYDLRDGEVGGLMVRVSQGGAKTFSLLYRANRYTLGTYPAMSLMQARERARALKESIKITASDPENAKAEEELAKKRGTSFETVLTEYIEKYAKINMGERSWKECQRVLSTGFSSRLGKRPIGSIRPGEIAAIIEEINDSGKPSAARHAHADIRRFCNWATGRRYFTTATNPCTE